MNCAMSDSVKTEKPLIEAVNVFKSYKIKDKSLDVLTGAGLVIQAGEILGIVGASGVGKSTLLHILGGLDRPQSGTILFKGENIFAQKNGFLEEYRNKHIGFVFQMYNLLPDFTALENTMFPGWIGNKNEKDVREQAENLLEQMGLKDRLYHKPGELSGGEVQRVALARSLVNKPDLLLADEPTGNLDSNASDSFMDLMIQLNEKFNQTFVIVTHSQKIARRMGRVLQLVDGLVTPIDKDLIL